MPTRSIILFLFLFSAAAADRAGWEQPDTGDYVIRNFVFQSGEALPELRMHYRTFGRPRRAPNGLVSNAILILHGTTGNGSNFLRREFAGELFGPGQLLDASRYYLILPDNIGHGGSSKPSDGLRGRFPHYGYGDMIEAQHRLLTEGLQLNHLRLVLGTSMGGMHTWLWAETYPRFMDAAMPLASLPSQISGRNRVWRRMIIDAIRTSPDWEKGNYDHEPSGLRVAAEVLYFMGSNPLQRQKEGPSLAAADHALELYLTNALARLDANDVLYALESSRDYDPAPPLEQIRARLLAVNFADDLINPPELRLLESEIRRVKNGKAVVIPQSDQTRGHGTHTLATTWKKHLAWLLDKSEPSKKGVTKPRPGGY